LQNHDQHSGTIAAVVVSHHSASTLDECLRRLRRATGVCQIRVVDNASSDGSLEIIQRQALADVRLRFIANADNLGFAAACNQGANAIHAPWLVFIKPDVMVETDTLARLRDLGQPLGACLLGVEHINEYGVLDNTVPCYDPDFIALLRHPFSAFPLTVARDFEKVLQVVPALSSALLLISRELFEQLNGWDSGYHCHAEDWDLCRRVREAGAIVAIVNTPSVLRLNDASASNPLHPFFVQWHKHRGLWRYFCTFQAEQQTWLIRVAVAATLSARAVLSLIRALWQRA